MGQKYIIDTNILIDAQMKKLPKKGLVFLGDVINRILLFHLLATSNF